MAVMCGRARASEYCSAGPGNRNQRQASMCITGYRRNKACVSSEFTIAFQPREWRMPRLPDAISPRGRGCQTRPLSC